MLKNARWLCFHYYDFVEWCVNLAEKVLKAERALTLAADMSKKYYNAPLILTYSGGKDSDVMLNLAEKALKADEFEVLNSHTSVDAPETVYHIREVFKRLNDSGIKATVNYPKDKDGNHITMWNLIPKKKFPPTRLIRYCCKVLKETSTPNRLCALGVRAAESNGRQGRDTFSNRGASKDKALFFSLDHAEEVHQESQEIQDSAWDCTLIRMMKEHDDMIVNPIYEWTDMDVWGYIRQNNVKINPLYARGYTRVGCIGCPMHTYKQKLRDFAEYPTYKQAYIKAFDKMLENYDGKETWKTGEDVFWWWIEAGKHEVKGQINIFDAR